MRRNHILSFLGIVFFCFNACIYSKKSTAVFVVPFQLLSAQKEDFHSGAPGGNSGTNYYIKVKINTDNTVVFDSIWVENKAQKLKVVKNKKLLTNQSEIVNGDTLILRTTLLDNEINNIQTKTVIDFNNDQALIKFYINNNKKYFLVPSIIEIIGPLRP